MILIHGYMAGPSRSKNAIQSGLRPIVGFDVVLHVAVPRLARAYGYGAVPEFSRRRSAPQRQGRQSLFDLQNLLGWLLRQGHPRVGVNGMSLGGYTAALLATAEPRLDFVVPVIPLSSLADFAREPPAQPRPRRSRCAARAARKHLPPGEPGGPPVARPARTLLGRRCQSGPRYSSRPRPPPLRAPARAATIFYGGHLLQLGRAEAFELRHRAHVHATTLNPGRLHGDPATPPRPGSTAARRPQLRPPSSRSPFPTPPNDLYAQSPARTDPKEIKLINSNGCVASLKRRR